jgi:predicted nucleic acid-binding protein
MSLKRTFIDAGVLISAARGTGKEAKAAMEILDDPSREFASSTFLKLEVLPKANYYNYKEEAEFYTSFFNNDVTCWASANEDLVEFAQIQANHFGLGAMDSLHVAAAISLGADEIVTTENPTKPIYRVTDIKVATL